jgi:hypothetical protein
MNSWHRAMMLLSIVQLTMFSGAVVAPSIQVDNQPDARLEIIPLDDAHASLAPASLGVLSTKLPVGSFILKNNTDTPVTAIAAIWNYTDAGGQLQHHQLNCDAYLLPEREPLVKPHDLALVTAFGCTTQDVFPALAKGAVLGAPLGTAGQKPMSSAPGIPMHLYVDSVIFADGQIWGRDTFDYSAKLRDRYDAIQYVTAQVSAGRSAGEDTTSLLSGILADASSKPDSASALRARYAVMFLRSHNPEKVLQQFQAQAPLPLFRHVGGNAQ